MTDNIARLEVSGGAAIAFEDSPYMLTAAAKMVRAKLPHATMLEVYRDGGLIARIVLKQEEPA